MWVHGPSNEVGNLNVRSLHLYLAEQPEWGVKRRDCQTQPQTKPHEPLMLEKRTGHG